MPKTAEQRELFVGNLCRTAGVLDPRIARAFGSVERERFLGNGPWFVSEGGDLSPTSDPSFVYQDIVIGISQRQGITNGLPSLHARCLEALGAARSGTVIHIGAGSGYYTAVLAELVGHGGKVVAFEIDGELAIRARANLRAYPNVEVYSESGVSATFADADAIYVNAGVSDLPRRWLDALRPGGRLVFPLVPGKAVGAMWKITKRRSGFEATVIAPAKFYPCIGAQDNDANLLAAYSRGRVESVRSLRLDDPGDGQSWYVGRGWWLSTEPVSD